MSKRQRDGGARFLPLVAHRSRKKLDSIVSRWYQRISDAVRANGEINLAAAFEKTWNFCTGERVDHRDVTHRSFRSFYRDITLSRYTQATLVRFHRWKVTIMEQLSKYHDTPLDAGCATSVRRKLRYQQISGWSQVTALPTNYPTGTDHDTRDRKSVV